mgnify:CR=1
ACQHSDSVFPHLATGMGKDFMIIVKLYPEHRVGKQFGHGAGKFYHAFFGHTVLSLFACNLSGGQCWSFLFKRSSFLVLCSEIICQKPVDLISNL